MDLDSDGSLSLLSGVGRDELECDLAELIERRWNDRLFSRISDRTFVAELIFHKKGRPVGDFRKAWNRACKAAGVPERTFHDLRRSYARNAEMAGVPRSVAMATGGWKTDATYSRYNIVDVVRLRQARGRCSWSTLCRMAQKAGT
jgi:integrase